MSFLGNFPFYYQRGTYGCGLASLKMVMDYYGKKKTLHGIKAACEISGRGAFLSDLATGAEMLGFCTLVIRCDINDLEHKITLPAIALWNNNHYIVIYNIDEEWVYVADPALGKLNYSYNDFKNGWYVNGENKGIVLVIDEKEAR